MLEAIPRRTFDPALYLIKPSTKSPIDVDQDTKINKIHDKLVHKDPNQTHLCHYFLILHSE